MYGSRKGKPVAKKQLDKGTKSTESKPEVKRVNNYANAVHKKKATLAVENELALGRFKHQIEGLLDQLKLQKKQNEHLNYTQKIENMTRLREAHQHAVNTILEYAQAAQRIVSRGEVSASFRKELAVLIHQLALYCAELESDFDQVNMEKSQKKKTLDDFGDDELKNIFLQSLSQRDKSNAVIGKPKKDIVVTQEEKCATGKKLRNAARSVQIQTEPQFKKHHEITPVSLEPRTLSAEEFLIHSLDEVVGNIDPLTDFIIDVILEDTVNWLSKMEEEEVNNQNQWLLQQQQYQEEDRLMAQRLQQQLEEDRLRLQHQQQLEEERFMAQRLQQEAEEQLRERRREELRMIEEDEQDIALELQKIYTQLDSTEKEMREIENKRKEQNQLLDAQRREEELRALEEIRKREEEAVLQKFIQEEELEQPIFTSTTSSTRQEPWQIVEILADYIIDVVLTATANDFSNACDKYIETLIKAEWADPALAS